MSSNFQDNTIICNGDVDILTVDDASRIRQGLSPQKYDAFVLFAEDDIAFATEVIDTMEKQYYLKFCVKDRDMVGGTVESDAIIKLITERCNRLIVIISDAFIYSPWHKFFLTFAQKLGIGMLKFIVYIFEIMKRCRYINKKKMFHIHSLNDANKFNSCTFLEQKQRKIIPCRYSCCQVPQELSCYYILDYQRTSKLYNFWEKLNNSITTADITSRNLERYLLFYLKQYNFFLFKLIYRSKSQTNHQIETNSILPNQQVKPKRESVKFESNLNAKLPTPPNTPIEIEASSSGNMSVTEETKDGKAKLSCLLKLKSFLGVKVNRSHSDVTSKDKKKFWSRHVKSKVAVAN